MTSFASDPTVSLLVLGGAIAFTYVATCKMLNLGHDPREPPLAPQSIPLIGHMIGLSRSSFEYYVELSQRSQSPIFTLPLPGQKMYVIAQPDLIQAAQKQHHILAFPPVEVKFSKVVCSSSEEAQRILAHNINGDEGNFGLSMESHDGMVEAMKPGDRVDDMNRVMVKEVARSIDLLQPAAKGESHRVSLYEWFKVALTSATTRSVYGPMNPYEDRAIADAFWEFSNGMMSIIIGFFPSITARKPIAARDKVAKAFEKYYTAGGIKKASAIAQKRYEVESRHKVPLADTARYEVATSNAFLLNTTPAAFWTLLFIYSTPDLLEKIRKEVDACIETTAEKDSVVKSLDIATLKDNCPLLLSTYQETLRHRSMGISVREVMQDTMLDKWLLKKGAMLQMPGRIIHQDASLWGDDVKEFNPRRFLPEEKKNRPRDTCFRAFGGGKTLCPGRHFATNEVIATVALFVARLEMKPVEGQWRVPTGLKTDVAAVIMQPDDDVEVDVTTREGMDNVKWVVTLNKSDRMFALVSEDIIGEE